jgi:8-oxo-dGTP pyrophosphatase MutT (NUDIX family)
VPHHSDQPDNRATDSSAADSSAADSSAAAGRTTEPALGSSSFLPGDGLQRRPHGSGDAWVTGPDGRRFWGTFGAAGLLVLHPAGKVLLQHRAEWSHFGGTWGLPGGARHEGESALHGAMREASDEAGVPKQILQPLFSSRLDLGWWSYTSVIVRATEEFTPVIGDAESLELRWVAIDDVDELDLHPGFASAWPAMRPDLLLRPVVIIDSANVVGSRPDGWWRDRAGAATRLAERVSGLHGNGIPSDVLGLAHHRWWPEYRMVVEGQANAIHTIDGVSVIRSPRDGDSTIVEQVDAAGSTPDAPLFVVTADRELSGRVRELGARVIRPSNFLEALAERH